MIFKFRNLLAFLVIAIVFYWINNVDIEPNPNVYYGQAENVPDYQQLDKTILDSVENLKIRVRRYTNTSPKWKFAPPATSIFFHETSRSDTLGPRQACSVESAARMNPRWTVHVLFLTPMRKPSTISIKTLSTYKRIKFFHIDLLKFSKNTPLHDLISIGGLNHSRWPTFHTSDFIRFITLYKWGGVYLDLDVVVVKSFRNLTANWVAREDDISLGAGAFAFSQDEIGRDIALDAITDLSLNYKIDVWKNNGPDVLNRVFTKRCKTTDVSAWSAKICGGVEVYSAKQFYPYHHTEHQKYFEPTYLTEDIFNNEVYVHHFWNSMTSRFELSRDSLYTKLAKKYCPKIYKAFRKHFEASDENNKNIIDNIINHLSQNF